MKSDHLGLLSHEDLALHHYIVFILHINEVTLLFYDQQVVYICIYVYQGRKRSIAYHVGSSVICSSRPFFLGHISKRFHI